MRRAPAGDVLVVVAVGDGTADDEQKDLLQRMQDPPHVAWVLDLGEMIEQRREARLPGQSFGGQGFDERGQGRLRFRPPHVNGGGKPSHVAAQYTATSGIGYGRWVMARALARARSG